MGDEPTPAAASSDTPGSTGASFGALVQALRKSFGTHMHAKDPRVPHGLKLSARGLVESLGEVGYPISLEALGAIESGAVLPTDGAALIQAVCTALFLDVPGPEWSALTQQLAHERTGREASDESP